MASKPELTLCCGNMQTSRAATSQYFSIGNSVDVVEVVTQISCNIRRTAAAFTICVRTSISASPSHATMLPRETRNSPGKDLAVAGLFQNKVDHFNTSNSATYNQRYWYNDQWYKPGGPAFLMLGGESGEDPYWVEDGIGMYTSDSGAVKKERILG
ncbi:hypothetical protein ANCDUO_23027 [Ancylostoma duodenale]|uniref:Uncharacterized protein n=1 Tax=Ancylostoma duodenale TaxID=51022 RepID=A0A0C2FPV5_9BILA|nr:hypothetical protein ANCDUO_23027 [Ancylostoma duodenale]